MKCCDVEPLLDQMAGPSDHDRNADQSAMHDHLANCPSCRSAMRSLARWDRQLTEAMHDISVPAGLSQRLLASLHRPNSVSADPVSKPDSSRRTSNIKAARTAGGRVLRIIMGVVLCGLLAVAAWGTWRFISPPMVVPSDIATLLQQPIEQLEPANDSRSLLPGQWSSLGRKVTIRGWKQAELRSHRLTVAVIPLEVRLTRAPVVSGSLVVLPKSRWKPRVTLPVSQAAIQYSPPYVWISWIEGDLVYILSINGPAPVLEQLQHQLDGNNSVL